MYSVQFTANNNPRIDITFAEQTPQLPVQISIVATTLKGRVEINIPTGAQSTIIFQTLPGESSAPNSSLQSRVCIVVHPQESTSSESTPFSELGQSILLGTPPFPPNQGEVLEWDSKSRRGTTAHQLTPFQTNSISSNFPEENSNAKEKG